MTLVPGLDSFQQPNRAQADALWNDGYRWWAFNVGGESAADVWAHATTAGMLEDHPWELLPIWVISLAVVGNGAADARQAIALAAGYGITGVIGADTEIQEKGNPRLVSYMNDFAAEVTVEHDADVCYRGAGYLPPGACAWIPSWINSPPTALPPRTAWQWKGNTTVGGVLVDLNVATPDFPLWSPIPVPPPPPPPVPEDIDMIGQTSLGPIAVNDIGEVYQISNSRAVYRGALNAHSGPSWGLKIVANGPLGPDGRPTNTGSTKVVGITGIEGDAAGGYMIVVTGPQFVGTPPGPYRSYLFPGSGAAVGTTAY